jgi:hypothetical protein
VMLPSWLFALLLGFSLCIAVNLTSQLLPLSVNFATLVAIISLFRKLPNYGFCNNSGSFAILVAIRSSTV